MPSEQPPTGTRSNSQKPIHLIRKGSHKYGKNEKIDPERYRDFVGDLRGTGINVSGSNQNQSSGFNMIDNAIPLDIVTSIRANRAQMIARDPSAGFR